MNCICIVGKVFNPDAAISYMSNGSSVQTGAHWESWVATCGPNHRPVKMPVKFGCGHGIYVSLRHFFGSCWKKGGPERTQHYSAPNAASLYDVKHSVGTSPINPRLENNWHAGSAIGAEHGRIWENHVKDKKTWPHLQIQGKFREIAYIQTLWHIWNRYSMIQSECTHARCHQEFPSPGFRHCECCLDLGHSSLSNSIFLKCDATWMFGLRSFFQFWLVVWKIFYFSIYWE